MGTSDNTSTAPVTTAASTAAEESSQQNLGLPEPPADSKAVELEMRSGQGVKLDHLGPMVVNRDGTLSRIANWEQMAEIERQNTLRILGKRNQLRMETLRADEDGKAAE